MEANLFNFHSSYTPPMRNVTPKPEALPSPGLPKPKNSGFIDADFDVK